MDRVTQMAACVTATGSISTRGTLMPFHLWRVLRPDRLSTAPKPFAVTIPMMLVLLTVTLTPLAAYASDSTTPVATLQGPNVVDYTGSEYAQDLMSDVHKFVLHGTRMVDGGCAIAYEYKLEPTEHDITQEELAFDPDTCTSLVARGHLLSRDLSYRQSGVGNSAMGLSRGSSNSAVGNASVPTGSSAASTSSPYGGWYGDPNRVPSATYSANTYRAYQDSWYDEPLRWVPPNKRTYGEIAPTTEALNAIEWTPGGGCGVAPGTIAYFSSYDFWLAETSWNLTSRYFTTPPTYLSCADRPFSQSDTSYENEAFCTVAGAIGGGILGGILGRVNVTHARYNPNYIFGWEDGSLNSYGIMYKDGLCSKLLQEKHQTSRY